MLSKLNKSLKMGGGTKHLNKIKDIKLYKSNFKVQIS